jgi:Glu-tRNA(Gln) amidotransferase subunit E-like FAD-binding protein
MFNKPMSKIMAIDRHGKVQINLVKACHTRFLRPKPDAHRMYAQDQVGIHTVRM